jgi:predicted dehydrogenase
MAHGEPLNWGILGPGIIARKMADALRLHPDSKLFAVASKTLEKAERFARDHGHVQALSYRELVEHTEIDAVYVATTHNYHYENARLALEHGKHVLIEKPFTVNAQQAQTLVDLAATQNRFLMEAIWTRFLPSYRLLKRRLQEGMISELQLFDISFGGIAGPEYIHRLTSPDLAGGATLDLGIYPISFVCYMLGELPEEIQSMVQFSETGVDEVAVYQFRFPSGCFATIKASYNLKVDNTARIYGRKGYVIYPEFQAGPRFSVSLHNHSNEVAQTDEVYEENHANGFVYQVEEVVRCVREGRRESDVIPLRETVAIMEVMDWMRAQWGLRYPFE